MLGEDLEEPYIENLRVLSGDQSFNSGTKVTMNGPATITYLSATEMTVFQLLNQAETETKSPGDIATYDKDTVLECHGNGKVKFLQETYFLSTLPYRSQPEYTTYAKDAEVFLVNAQKIKLIDPAKVSIQFIDSLEISIVAPSNHVVVQNSNDVAGALIIPCNPVCKSCKGPTKFDCTDCYSNFYFENGTCVCPTIGFILSNTQMKDSYEPNGYRNEFTCNKCHTSCLSCNGVSDQQCLSCPLTSWTLQLSDIYSKVDSRYKMCFKAGIECQNHGMYSLDFPTQVCKKCHPNCATCSGPGDQFCLSCKFDAQFPENTMYYYDKQCYQSCPDAYTHDGGSNNCYPCSVGIKTCGVGEPSFAIACNDDLFFISENFNGRVENSCVERCPDGYFGERLTASCQLCDSKCALCSGSATTCQLCATKSFSILRYFFKKDKQECLETCGESYRELVNEQTGMATCGNIPCSIENRAKNGCMFTDNFCDVCTERVYDTITKNFKEVLHDAQNGTCIVCSDLPTIFRIDASGNCYNICGNGYLYNIGSHDKSTCDDGNTIDGDGCSSTCYIEPDYVCKRGDVTTPLFEIPEKTNKDKCVEQLKVDFKMNVENATGNPKLDLIFNDDVCIGKETFFEIYEPYCIKKNEANGLRVKVLTFEFYEIDVCRTYIIEYVLKDNYSGNLSFLRMDDPNLAESEKQQIYDSRNNVVDFTKVETFVFFDNSDMLAKKKLEETKKQLEKLLANVKNISTCIGYCISKSCK